MIGHSGAVLRGDEPPPPQGETPESRFMKGIFQEWADQDRAEAQARKPFLLTNPERRSCAEKKPGMIQLHQCSPNGGRAKRCKCEYITEADAAKLEKKNIGRYIRAGHMCLKLSQEDWLNLAHHLGDLRRASLDKKNAKIREQTYKRKLFNIVGQFNYLLVSQGLDPLGDDKIYAILENLTDLVEMFPKDIAFYQAQQIANAYWNLILDREDLNEEGGAMIQGKREASPFMHDVSGIGRGDKAVGADERFVRWGPIEKLLAARDAYTNKRRPPGYGPDFKKSSDEKDET